MINYLINRSIRLTRDEILQLRRYVLVEEGDEATIHQIIANSITPSTNGRTRQGGIKLLDYVTINKETWILCQGISLFAICAYCAVKKVKPWRIAVVIFFSSWGWTWIHLYQLAMAKQQATLSRLSHIPDTCQKQSWYSALTNILHGESEASQCDAYYSALLVNPVLEATPIRALTEMISLFVLRPLQLLGESLGIYYKTLLDPLPLVWKIPCLLTGTFFLCFLFLLTFRYSITTPFGIVTIEPSSKRRNTAIKTDKSKKELKNSGKESMFSVMWKRMMNKNEECQNAKTITENNEKLAVENDEPPYPTGQKARDLDSMFPTNVSN